MNATTPMLQVNRLAKRFTLHVLGAKRIEAFSGVGFAVDAGRALVLSGPSGTGKSSVLKCIHRTYRPSAGSIRYRSPSMGTVDLAELDEHRVLRLRQGEIGYVTQFLKVLPRVPTVAVVAEPLTSRGVPPEAARAAAEGHLARLGIPRRLFDAFPATFSGGEQQRVNLARAIIARPRLLLLDEPTASLDPEATAVVLAMLRELKADGTAMVAVFHDRETAEGVADDFYRL